VYVNDEYAKLWGYTEEEFIGLHIDRITYKEDRELVQERVRARISGEIHSMRYEGRGVRKDGTVKWVEVFGTRTIYKGSPALISCLVDITERKKAEKQLMESEEKFRNLVEQSLAGVFIIQEEKFVYVNPAFENIVGYSGDQLVNRLSLSQLVHEDDKERIKEIYEKGTSRSLYQPLCIMTGRPSLVLQ
jgi:PAS domain S-box-containing protein